MIALLRHIIFEDFKLKLFSLGLAVLVWFTISFVVKNDMAPLSNLPMTGDSRTFHNLPVWVVSPAEVRQFKIEPQEAAVTVLGDARALRALKAQDIRVLVNLTGLDPATGIARKRLEISTPAGITHVRVMPPEVRVLFPDKK